MSCLPSAVPHGCLWHVFKGLLVPTRNEAWEAVSSPICLNYTGKDFHLSTTGRSCNPKITRTHICTCVDSKRYLGEDRKSCLLQSMLNYCFISIFLYFISFTTFLSILSVGSHANINLISVSIVFSQAFGYFNHWI